MRIFIAVELPDAAAERASALLPGELPALRRVDPSQLHLTLAFLGETAPERLADVAEAVRTAAARMAPFDVTLHELGRFPASGRPSVVWLRARDDAPVAALAERVRAALRHRSIAFDEKPFRAHVTLARVREGVAQAEAAAVVAALRAAPGPRIRFRADAVHVIQSTLSPKGARYASLEVVPLSGTT